MGLAGTKVKQRFGLDPRNTNWSNDTNRFGHQYLEKLGWEPGKGLGLVQHAVTSHVKVSIKDDNVGLGAKLKKKSNDPLDDDDTHGLDAFQRILGRLNGRESVIDKALDQKRKDRIIHGKLGIQFVKGDVLKSTWDTETKTLKEEKKSKKRKRDEDGKDSKKVKKEKKNKDSVKSEEKSDKKAKKDKKDKKEKKKKSKKSSDEGEDKKDKKEKKIKKEKKEKKEKKKEKKEKKEKKDKSDKKEESVKSESLVPATGVKPIATRLSSRSKYIKQKRASVMDQKLLNEIFMITN